MRIIATLNLGVLKAHLHNHYLQYCGTVLHYEHRIYVPQPGFLSKVFRCAVMYNGANKEMIIRGPHCSCDVPLKYRMYVTAKQMRCKPYTSFSQTNWQIAIFHFLGQLDYITS